MATKFNASQVSVRSLYSNNNILFSIPAYQRGYSWTKEEALVLFNDIKEFSKNRNQNQSYYIGNIILQQDDTEQSTKKTVYQVVDGQQRMTTMLLIIAGLRNEIKIRIGSKVGNFDLLDDLRRDLERLIYFDSSASRGADLQLKVYNKDYNENMKAVIENTYNDGLGYNSNYFDNYHNILTQGIQNLKGDKEIKEFIDALEDVVMVEVILSSSDNALVVFENINSKGHELTAHDLIKNYSYILAASIPAIERDYFDEKITKIFDSKIKDNIENNAELNTFWRVVCSILNNKKQPVNKPKEIYNSFKLAAKEKLNISGNTESEFMSERLETLLNTIERNYEIYKEINDLKGNAYTLKERWQRSVSLMADKTFDSVAPMLFKIYNDFKDDRISESDFKESIIAVNKYKIRRKLAYDQIKDLKNFSMKIVEYFNKSDVKLAFTRKNFVDYLEKVASKSIYNKNIDNIDFKSSLMKNDLYNNNAAEEILIEYEYSLNKNETIMADSKRKIQVEHIMPQTIYDVNKKKYYEGWDNIDLNEHNEWKNTFGNLTLTFDNQEMGNKPYDKKQKYYSESNLRVNSYFGNIDFWDFDKIKERTKALQEEIVKLWEI